LLLFCVDSLVLPRRRHVIDSIYVTPAIDLQANSGFNRIVPRKTLEGLMETTEDGLFVVCAKIVGLYHVDKCLYLCGHCNRTSFNISCK
jgi:hypothetical protein